MWKGNTEIRHMIFRVINVPKIIFLSPKSLAQKVCWLWDITDP